MTISLIHVRSRKENVVLIRCTNYTIRVVVMMVLAYAICFFDLKMWCSLSEIVSVFCLVVNHVEYHVTQQSVRTQR